MVTTQKYQRHPFRLYLGTKQKHDCHLDSPHSATPPGEAKGVCANSPWFFQNCILRTAADPSGAMRRLPFQGRLGVFVEFVRKEYFPDPLILGLQYCMIDACINEACQAPALPVIRSARKGREPRTIKEVLS